jgi:hypothetical protein
MSAQFLLFVIAILLFAVFWELCKINTLLKWALRNPARTLRGGHENDAASAKALD